MNGNPKISETELAQRLRLEALIADLCARCVEMPPGDIDGEIQAGLRQIVEFLDIDQSALMAFTEDGSKAVITHSYLRDGSRFKDTIEAPDKSLPGYAQLCRGEAYAVERLDDLPAEAVLEKNRFLAIGMKSFLIIPIQARQNLIGAVCFCSFRTTCTWPTYLIPRFRLIGKVFVNALTRKQNHESLREAEFLYRTVADFTYDWEYWKNPDGTLHYVSPSCERISGYTAQEFMGRPSLCRDIVVPEDRQIWDDHDASGENALKAEEIQFRIRKKNGEIRWIEHVHRAIRDDHGVFLGFRVSNRDISKRKVTEETLHKALIEIQHLKDQLEAENIYLREEIKLDHNYKKIIGQSAALKYALFRVEQVAPLDTNVLILGDTGTGKELVARAVHEASPRKDRPLIKVNCANLPPHLIESELFGHEKGAFSGAEGRREGRFELADGATLFLDEIGELPLELQPKLLRVLQDGEFERLGSSRTRKTNVRVIAATNRDLEEEVRNGRFREDLWFRLNVFPITVPPLRQRKLDIPLLVKWFVAKFTRKLGKPIESIPQSVIDQLMKYSWPGNIRELENVIERSVIITRGSVLQLAEYLKTPDAPPALQRETKTLAYMEREYMLQVLEQTSWRIEGRNGAANALDLSPSTFRDRMKKLGIERPQSPFQNP